MKGYDTYVLVLCIIVFIVLTALSAVFIKYIVKLSVRLIDIGEQDEEIQAEFEKQNQKKSRVIAYVFNALFALVFVGIFSFSLMVNMKTESVSATVPTLRVVLSSSMAEKFSENKYLEENELNDQFYTHDLLLTYKLPEEFDLKLYDIVVYEANGELIIHRIVEIEEPNEKHPDCRHFRLQGDAVQYPDRFPVLYSQMRGIYRGENVRFVGSFVIFMRSFAGWLCVGLLVASAALAPVLDNYMQKKKKQRYLQMSAASEKASQDVEQV